jgi:hypothetical protein
MRNGVGVGILLDDRFPQHAASEALGGRGHVAEAALHLQPRLDSRRPSSHKEHSTSKR